MLEILQSVLGRVGSSLDLAIILIFGTVGYVLGLSPIVTDSIVSIEPGASAIVVAAFALGVKQLDDHMREKRRGRRALDFALSDLADYVGEQLRRAESTPRGNEERLKALISLEQKIRTEQALARSRVLREQNIETRVASLVEELRGIPPVAIPSARLARPEVE